MDDVVDDLLIHYGKKGMKWGVRKRRSVAVDTGPTPVMVGVKPGAKLKARGGKNQPPSDEAIRAVGLRQKAKKSGIQSLTNKEVEELNKRLNLEQNYRNLVSGSNKAQRTVGRKVADGLLQEAGKITMTQARAATNQALAKKLAKKVPTP